METARRENLERLVAWKLISELKLYRHKILSYSKEEVYQSAFEIDARQQIYELFVQQIPILSNQCLQTCIAKSNLLEFLFQSWMNTPDTQTEEINYMIWKSIHQLVGNIV